MFWSPRGELGCKHKRLTVEDVFCCGLIAHDKGKILQKSLFIIFISKFQSDMSAPRWEGHKF